MYRGFSCFEFHELTLKKKSLHLNFFLVLQKSKLVSKKSRIYYSTGVQLFKVFQVVFQAYF